MLFSRCVTAISVHQRLPSWMGQMPQRLEGRSVDVRWLHQSIPARAPHTLAPLPARKFVRVHGPDSASFLQGLMTNDMRHFQHRGTMYAMFLKANGRIFCDTLVYKRPVGDEEHDYLLECDDAVAPRLEKHLKLYRLRKQVQVALDETYRMWVAFRQRPEGDEDLPEEDAESAGPACPEGSLHVFKDPRLPRLGYRVLAPAEQLDTAERLKHLFPDASTPAESSQSYVNFRYSLGVGEGEENLPDGKCFPLECNCDFLYGVSFNKGCYIGQELTARTYHTGVIRKRLMPVEFDSPPPLDLSPDVLRDAEMKNGDGAAVGKLRGLSGRHGLGLLRIEKVLPSGELTLTVSGKAVPCRTRKPSWWPQDANVRT